MNPFKQPRILIGTALVILGIVFIMMNVGIIQHVPLHHFWPMILIFIGMSKLVQGTGGRGRWSGVWMLLLGIWFQLVTLRMFGLTYHNSWPVMLIIWGVYLSAEALSRKSNNGLTQEKLQ